MHARGRAFPYDALVIATGSYPAVPPVPGSDLPGAFVYRTVDDVTELRAWATTRNLKRPVRGAVVGGGLLGLEAAGALTAMGVETTVVEFAPRLMPIQVDEGGGEGLRRLIEKLGVSRAHVHRHLQGARRVQRPGEPDGLRRRLQAARRPGRVRHRRAAPRRARPRRRPRGRRARRRGRRRGLCDRACRTSTRSARSPASRAAPGAWWRPATRWPRSSPTGCSAARPPSRAPTPPPSSSSSGSTSPASATRSPSPPARSRWCTPTRWPGPTRSSWSPTTRRPCSAACSSATPAPTPRCARWSARSWAPTRPRGCCPREPLPRPRRTCPTPRTSAPATTSAPARSGARSATRAARTSPG